MMYLIFPKSLEKFFFTFILLIFSPIYIGQAQETKSLIADKYPIIPTPQQLSYGTGQIYFTNFQAPNSIFPNEVNLLRNFLIEQGIKPNQDGIKIKFIHKALEKVENDEAYFLKIDSTVTIQAGHKKGAFYAVQTLKQIFRGIGNKGVFPKLIIRDWPNFKIRGFMHDTGRNFQSVALLKEQIDIMSKYKLNVFHWHLTDYPGWRLESKIHPELNANHSMTRQKGKFYTQEDFKEILAYCEERNITLIPEFDIPGHTDAFRKAFDLESMKDPKVLPILLDLFNELCSLADAKEMPYIHIGTDEVRKTEEQISEESIIEIMNLLKKEDREVIVWKEGISLKSDSTSINQLWASYDTRKGHRFIDSRSNYINHLDPFAGMTRLFFQQPARRYKGDDMALGGILCAWPDNNVADERDILKQNPIYPSIVFYADAIWKGRKKGHRDYWAKLPEEHRPEFIAFNKFEKKVIAHRDLFFQGKEFPYLKQTEIKWKVIGPFDHQGDVNRSFPVEKSIRTNYKVDKNTFTWSETKIGATIHFKHFFGFPALTEEKTGTYYAYTNIYSPDNRIQDFWIGFQGWSRSSRRGGPTPNLGQWHTTNPKIWVNDVEIDPPKWKQPNLDENTHEIPFKDEDYFYRAPTQIKLKKGLNKILLKIPQNDKSWKWMFTCVPININKHGVKEVKDLIFNPRLKIYSDHYNKLKEQFKNELNTPNEIIFLGNSITEGGSWKVLFPEVNAINRGISGDVTQGIIDRLDEVTSSKPKKIFLLIGINDLARGKTVEYVTLRIEKIIQQISNEIPNSELYVQSILPVNPMIGDQFKGHKSKIQEILLVNKRLRILTDKYNVNYINLHSEFVNNRGLLKKKYSNDGLHLNKIGYKNWKKSIKQHVNL